MTLPPSSAATDPSRRTVLKAFSLGTVLALAGCSSAVTEQNAAAKGKAAQPGGTLKMGLTQDLIPGNFFTNSSAGLTTTMGLVFETLIRYPNDKVEAQPFLATSWQLAEDGKFLTLLLRDDVTFHDGRPFTSKDVEFSLKTYADPKWNGQLKSTAQAITSYDTSKPHEVTLHFAHPLSNIFDLLDTAPIVDSESIEELGLGKKYNGTGPFTFVSWTPNSKLVFAKNPSYWVPDRPYLDGVEVSIIPSSTSLLSAVKSRQLSLANGVSYRDIETVSDSGGFSFIQGAGAEQQVYVGANVTAAGLNDIRLRQAIAYALDRQRIIDEVFRGSGYVINLPWPTYSVAYDEAKNRTYGRDLAKAKSLVAAIGDVPELPLSYNATDASLTATAQILQSDLRAAGIPVKLDPLDGAQFVKQLIGAQFPGIWTTFHSWAQYTPSTLAVSAYPFNAAKNSSQFSAADYSQHANGSWVVPDGAGQQALTEYAALSDDLLEYLFLIEIGVVQPRWLHADSLVDASYTKRWELQLTDAYLT